jgi:hypothetical protein
MMGRFGDSVANGFFGALGMFFAVIFFIAFLFLIYYFILRRIDWGNIIGKIIGGMFS